MGFSGINRSVCTSTLFCDFVCLYISAGLGSLVVSSVNSVCVPLSFELFSTPSFAGLGSRVAGSSVVAEGSAMFSSNLKSSFFFGASLGFCSSSSLSSKRFCNSSFSLASIDFMTISTYRYNVDNRSSFSTATVVDGGFVSNELVSAFFNVGFPPFPVPFDGTDGGFPPFPVPFGVTNGDGPPPFPAPFPPPFGVTNDPVFSVFS